MRTLLPLAVFVLGLGSAWGNPTQEPSQKTRLIVGFKPDLTAQQRDQLVKGLGLKIVDRIEEPINIDVVEAPKASAGVKAVQLKATPGVDNVEEDFFVNWVKESPVGFMQAPFVSPALREFQQTLPPLPLGPDIKTGEIPWGVQRVNAPAVWNKNDPKSQGAGVRVAIIDSGIDCSHPDLTCDLSEGVNEVDPKVPPKDDFGHGTHVAGTVAAKWDDQGVVGVAPLAHLVPVKVLDSEGSGYLSNVIKGIMWAADPKHHIQVASMSLGAPKASLFMHLAVQWARLHGVTIVAAAGNEGPGDNTVGYPGGFPEVITVAASARNPLDTVAKFSSRGKQVKFIAPGVDVMSTVPGGEYAAHAGTSMATPHVSGLAALAVAQGARSPDEVFAALKAAATKLPGLSANEQGFGMIDAAKIPHRMSRLP